MDSSSLVCVHFLPSWVRFSRPEMLTSFAQCCRSHSQTSRRSCSSCGAGRKPCHGGCDRRSCSTSRKSCNEGHDHSDRRGRSSCSSSPGSGPGSGPSSGPSSGSPGGWADRCSWRSSSQQGPSYRFDNGTIAQIRSYRHGYFDGRDRRCQNSGRTKRGWPSNGQKIRLRVIVACGIQSGSECAAGDCCGSGNTTINAHALSWIRTLFPAFIIGVRKLQMKGYYNVCTATQGPDRQNTQFSTQLIHNWVHIFRFPCLQSSDPMVHLLNRREPDQFGNS